MFPHMYKVRPPGKSHGQVKTTPGTSENSQEEAKIPAKSSPGTSQEQIKSEKTKEQIIIPARSLRKPLKETKIPDRSPEKSQEPVASSAISENPQARTKVSPTAGTSQEQLQSSRGSLKKSQEPVASSAISENPQARTKVSPTAGTSQEQLQSSRGSLKKSQEPVASSAISENPQARTKVSPTAGTSQEQLQSSRGSLKKSQEPVASSAISENPQARTKVSPTAGTSQEQLQSSRGSLKKSQEPVASSAISENPQARTKVSPTAGTSQEQLQSSRGSLKKSQEPVASSAISENPQARTKVSPTAGTSQEQLQSSRGSLKKSQEPVASSAISENPQARTKVSPTAGTSQEQLQSSRGSLKKSQEPLASSAISENPQARTKVSPTAGTSQEQLQSSRRSPEKSQGEGNTPVVAPIASEEIKSEIMSSDLEKRQASWRRNSQKWGSQGSEGGCNSSVPQTPPPIPAPPSDPQDNLAKKPVSILKGSPVKKELATLANFQEDQNDISQIENAEPSRGRSRSRPARMDEDLEPTRPSQNSSSNGNLGEEVLSTSFSRRGSSPVRWKMPIPEEESSERSSSVPTRRRRRNETNDDEHNTSISPPVRRRFREVISSEVPNQEDDVPSSRRRRRDQLQDEIRSENLSSNEQNLSEPTTNQELHQASIKIELKAPVIMVVNQPQNDSMGDTIANVPKSQEVSSEPVEVKSRSRSPTAEAEFSYVDGSIMDVNDNSCEDGATSEWKDKVDSENAKLEDATRQWLESQGSKPALERAVSVKQSVDLTDEDMAIDPLEELERKNTRQESLYEDWDAEPVDDAIPEFLTTILKKRDTDDNSRRGSAVDDESEIPEFLTVNLRKAEKTSKLKKSPTRTDSQEKDQINEKSMIKTTSELPPAPAPPPAPPPPPPPPSRPLSEEERKLKKAREKMVDQIKKATRTRPDWHSVMKDIEGGIKLRRLDSVLKSDRSRPVLPTSRGKGGKFVYDSEKPMLHNEMLSEIHRGIKLRHVRTNDRSKPDFNKLGIRKLRRQLTTEDKKTMDFESVDALPSSSDEEEDIDQMRDDLQSTKTQLAEEIKKTKKMERENKILKIDLESLQVEVKRMKKRLKEAGIREVKPMSNGEADAIAPKLSKSMSKLRMREEDMDFSELDMIEEDIKTLNDQIEAQRKRAEKAEKKCEDLTQKLNLTENSTEEWESRSIYFEKKYKTLQKEQGIELPDINCIGTQTDYVEVQIPDGIGLGSLPAKKSMSRKSFGKLNRMESFKEEAEEESDECSSSEDEEESGSEQGGEAEGREDLESEHENEDEKRAENETIRRDREYKMWQNRLCHAKEKIKNVKRERNNNRDRIMRYYKDMRKEREEYLKVKAELKDLADQMKEEPVDSEGSYDSDSACSDQDGEANKRQRKAVKKRKTLISQCTQEDEEEEEENHEDDPVDLSDLDFPEWPPSEEEDAEEENEDEEITSRIKKLKDLTERYEQLLNEKKKDNYLLKSQIDECDELYGEERRRHTRLHSELLMLLSDI